jgi:hypothetical protein
MSLAGQNGLQFTETVSMLCGANLWNTVKVRFWLRVPSNFCLKWSRILELLYFEMHLGGVKKLLKQVDHETMWPWVLFEKFTELLLMGYTGAGWNNANTADTVHIYLLILCWITFRLQYNCSPWDDPYKFWTACSGILYHSSWRTSSSYFRDVGGGNLFLTLVSKTHQSGSVMFKYGDCASQGKWISPSCSSNHDWIVAAVWMGNK